MVFVYKTWYWYQKHNGNQHNDKYTLAVCGYQCCQQVHQIGAIFVKLLAIMVVYGSVGDHHAQMLSLLSAFTVG